MSVWLVVALCGMWFLAGAVLVFCHLQPKVDKLEDKLAHAERWNDFWRAVAGRQKEQLLERGLRAEDVVKFETEGEQWQTTT